MTKISRKALVLFGVALAALSTLAACDAQFQFNLLLRRDISAPPAIPHEYEFVGVASSPRFPAVIAVNVRLANQQTPESSIYVYKGGSIKRVISTLHGQIRDGGGEVLHPTPDADATWVGSAEAIGFLSDSELLISVWLGSEGQIGPWEDLFVFDLEDGGLSRLTGAGAYGPTRVIAIDPDEGLLVYGVMAPPVLRVRGWPAEHWPVVIKWTSAEAGGSWPRDAKLPGRHPAQVKAVSTLLKERSLYAVALKEWSADDKSTWSILTRSPSLDDSVVVAEVESKVIPKLHASLYEHLCVASFDDGDCFAIVGADRTVNLREEVANRSGQQAVRIVGLLSDPARLAVVRDESNDLGTIDISDLLLGP